MHETIQRLRALADELERIWTAGVAELGLFTHALTPPPAPPPPIVKPPRPEPPVRPPPPPEPKEEPEPEFRKGYLDPLVWAQIQKVAPTVGVQPATLAAVQVHETGWYTSELFNDGDNVGGIKDTPYSRGLPGYDGPSESGVYATFVDWRAGIAAHARFLAQTRYDKIRTTNDPVAEVQAIHDAGYAEHDQAWLDGVTKLAKKFAGQLAAFPPVAPPKPTGDIGARIRAAALNLPDPFPYHEDTEEGNLGCANVVSFALREAGILDNIELAVRFLDARLQNLGWTVTSEPYKDGDVIVWGPRASGAHGHVGILIIEGGIVMTVQNSSSNRKVVHLPLVGYDRPIVRVLRAPGG